MRIKILPRVKALLKKNCLAPILLGISEVLFSSKISANVWSKMPSWSIAHVCAALATECYRHPIHFCGQTRFVPSISAFYFASSNASSKKTTGNSNNKAAITIIAVACRFLARSISNILTFIPKNNQALRVLYYLMLGIKMKTKCRFI